MRFIRALLCAALLLTVLPAQTLMAQTQSGSSAVPTIRVTSRLVFLDVTVLDKKGHPIVKGLSKNDFIVTEDKSPQRILSFEKPEMHVVDKHATDDNPAGKAPRTVFVLDLLNSRFQDFAYIRYSMRKYLAAQPEQLQSPAELLVLGNQSLEMVQGYTQSKADLLYALDHIPAALPYKLMNAAFYPERFGQSIDALQQIALQNMDVPGRKNIVWVGHGGPGIFMPVLTGPLVDDLNKYVRDTTNLLVNARVSLFLIYPGLRVNSAGVRISELSAMVDLSDDDDPFSGDINFGVFVNETGGKLFYNRNDVDHEIKQSQELGSEYYTLTYQPHKGDANGKFRHISVTLRNPNLRAVTKAGYFAPDRNSSTDRRMQTLENLSQALRSTLPLRTLDLAITDVVRHPDTRTLEFTVALKPSNITWEAAGSVKSEAGMMIAAASLSRPGDILASKAEKLILSAPTQDPAHLVKETMYIPLTIRVPRATQSVRVVMESRDGTQIGSATLDRKAIAAAPAKPTPEPQLVSHHTNQGQSTAPLAQ